MSRAKGDPFTIKRLLVPVSEDQIAAAVRHLESVGNVASKRNVAELMGHWATGGVELAAADGEPQDDGPTEYPVAADIFLLVGLRLTEKTWLSWTPEDRETAVDWAANGHSIASDNDVKRLPCPNYVAAAFGGLA